MQPFDWHLGLEESLASWMVKLFGEVGGGVREYSSSGGSFSIDDVGKSCREKTVLKTLLLEVFRSRHKKPIHKQCHGITDWLSDKRGLWPQLHVTAGKCYILG